MEKKLVIKNVLIVFVFFALFFSKIEALQCVDNGLTTEQYQSVTTSKAIIDTKWKELTTPTENLPITSVECIQAIHEKIRQYRDSQSYYSGNDIEVSNILFLYIEGLRVRWYQNCMKMIK